MSKGRSFNLVCNDPQVYAWMLTKMEATYAPEVSVNFGLEKDGEIVAGVVFDHYNGSSIAAHIAIKNKFCLTKEFLQVCFSYAFDEAKVKKIIGFVCSTNAAAIKLDQHLGFVCEGILKDCTPDGDLLLYTMTRDQCYVLR